MARELDFRKGPAAKGARSGSSRQEGSLWFFPAHRGFDRRTLLQERAGGFLNQWASLEGLTQPPNYGDGGAPGSGRNLEQIGGNLGAAYEGRIWLTIP